MGDPDWDELMRQDIETLAKEQGFSSVEELERHVARVNAQEHNEELRRSIRDGKHGPAAQFGQSIFDACGCRLAVAGIVGVLVVGVAHMSIRRRT